MDELAVSYQNIITGKGFELALAGMVIVIVALTLISTIVTLLPVLLKVISKIHPEKEKTTLKQRKSDIDEGLIAAIVGNIPSIASMPLGVYEIGSVLSYIYYGVMKGIFPPLIFLGIGAMTDFSTMLANPKLILFLGQLLKLEFL